MRHWPAVSVKPSGQTQIVLVDAVQEQVRVPVRGPVPAVARGRCSAGAAVGGVVATGAGVGASPPAELAGRPRWPPPGCGSSWPWSTAGAGVVPRRDAEGVDGVGVEPGQSGRERAGDRGGDGRCRAARRPYVVPDGPTAGGRRRTVPPGQRDGAGVSVVRTVSPLAALGASRATTAPMGWPPIATV